MNDPYSNMAAFSKQPLEASETTQGDPKRLRVNIEDMLMDGKVYGAEKVSRTQRGGKAAQSDSDDDEVDDQSEDQDDGDSSPDDAEEVEDDDQESDEEDGS